MKRTLSQIEYSIRGNVLASTVEIERKLDKYIARYFCHYQKKRDELCEMLLSTERMTMDLKIQIFDMILEVGMPQDLLTNLRAVNTARNAFAHLELDETQTSSESIVLKKYIKGKLKPKVFGQKELKLLMNQVAICNKQLDILLNR